MQKGEKALMKALLTEILEDVPSMWDHMVDDDGKVSVRIFQTTLDKVAVLLNPENKEFQKSPVARAER